MDTTQLAVTVPVGTTIVTKNIMGEVFYLVEYISPETYTDKATGKIIPYCHVSSTHRDQKIALQTVYDNVKNMGYDPLTKTAKWLSL